jgi:hypothetical protein
MGTDGRVVVASAARGLLPLPRDCSHVSDPMCRSQTSTSGRLDAPRGKLTACLCFPECYFF